MGKKFYKTPNTALVTLPCEPIMVDASIGTSNNPANPSAGMMSKRNGHIWDDVDIWDEEEF